MLHEGPWNAIDRQITAMHRKGNALLGLVATKDRGYLPPEDGHQQMLGKVDQMRAMLAEVERIVETLKPETQTKPKATWRCSRSGCDMKVDDHNEETGTQMKLCWSHRIW